MITVKQILEQYDIVTDKASSHDLYLADLASSGIIEEEKIPMLRRSLNKNINEMTVAEKKSLVSLIESLMANVIVEKSGGTMSYPSDKDMPTVIILKRKAIRVFPDNQKIGLYYSQALDRYISIPFGPNVKDLSPQLNEAYAPRGQSYSPGKRQSDEEKKKTATPPVLPVLSRIRQRTQKLTVAPKEKAPEESLVKRYLKAGPQERANIKQAGKVPSITDIANQTNAPKSDIAAGKLGLLVHDIFNRKKVQPAPSNSTPVSNPSQRVVGGTASPPPKAIPVKESFRENLRSIREERQLDEFAFLAPLAGAALGAGARLVGAEAIKRGAAAGARAAAQKGGGKIAQTIAKIRGGARGLAKSPLGKSIGAAAGVLGGLASGASSDSKEKPLFEPIQSQHTFTQAGSGAAPIVSGPGERANLSGQEVEKQRQVFGQKESTIYTLKQIVENNVPSQQLQIGEETISINKSIAKKIVKLHESLNRTNKKKLERMLNEDIVSFRKVVNFALK